MNQNGIERAKDVIAEFDNAIGDLETSHPESKGALIRETAGHMAHQINWLTSILARGGLTEPEKTQVLALIREITDRLAAAPAKIFLAQALEEPDETQAPGM